MVEFIGDIRDFKENNSSSVNDLSNLPTQEPKWIRIFIIMSSIILSISIVASHIITLLNQRTSIFYNIEYPGIFEINSIVMLCIFIVILIINTVFQLSFIFYSNDDDFLLFIFKNLRLRYAFANLLISQSLIIASTLSYKRDIVLIINLTQYSLVISKYNIYNLVLLFKTYRMIKRKRQFSCVNYITTFTYLSLIYSFILYIFAYYVINLIDLKVNLSDSEKLVLLFTTVIILCLISFSLMAHFKDVIYGLFYIILLAGYLLNKNKEEEKSIIIAIMIFLFITIIYVSVKFRHEAFGLTNKIEYSQIMNDYNMYKSTL